MPVRNQTLAKRQLRDVADLTENAGAIGGTNDDDMPDLDATAAAAALTGAANAAVTQITYTDPGGGTPSATPADMANGSVFATDFAMLEDQLASLFQGVNAAGVDIGLVLAQGDKSTVDIAAQKVELDKAITDLAATRDAVREVGVKLNAVLAAQRNKP